MALNMTPHADCYRVSTVHIWTCCTLRLQISNPPGTTTRTLKCFSQSVCQSPPWQSEKGDTNPSRTPKAQEP